MSKPFPEGGVSSLLCSYLLDVFSAVSPTLRLHFAQPSFWCSEMQPSSYCKCRVVFTAVSPPKFPLMAPLTSQQHLGAIRALDLGWALDLTGTHQTESGLTAKPTPWRIAPKAVQANGVSESAPAGCPDAEVWSVRSRAAWFALISPCLKNSHLISPRNVYLRGPDGPGSWAKQSILLLGHTF